MRPVLLALGELRNIRSLNLITGLHGCCAVGPDTAHLSSKDLGIRALEELKLEIQGMPILVLLIFFWCCEASNLSDVDGYVVEQLHEIAQSVFSGLHGLFHGLHCDERPNILHDRLVELVKSGLHGVGGTSKEGQTEGDRNAQKRSDIRYFHGCLAEAGADALFEVDQVVLLTLDRPLDKSRHVQQAVDHGTTQCEIRALAVRIRRTPLHATPLGLGHLLCNVLEAGRQVY